MKNLIAAAIALSGSVVSSPVSAGADDVTKYFMSQKVTMLDWGMFLLEQELKEDVVQDADGQFVMVHYSWSADEINISYRVVDIPNVERVFDDNKKVCRHFISEIRAKAGVGYDGKLLYDGFSSSFFTLNFLHNGFQTDRLGGEDKLSELDKKFKIRVDAYETACVADLIGSEIAFVE